MRICFSLTYFVFKKLVKSHNYFLDINIYLLHFSLISGIFLTHHLFRLISEDHKIQSKKTKNPPICNKNVVPITKKNKHKYLCMYTNKKYNIIICILPATRIFATTLIKQFFNLKHKLVGFPKKKKKKFLYTCYTLTLSCIMW